MGYNVLDSRGRDPKSKYASIDAKPTGERLIERRSTTIAHWPLLGRGDRSTPKS